MPALAGKFFTEYTPTVPVGTIISFSGEAGVNLPRFTECNGAIIDIDDSPKFTKLFNTIGAMYVKTWSNGETISSGELRKSISDGTVYEATSDGTTDGTDISDDSGVTWVEASTKFQLPDLRGEFLRGYDHGRGIDSGRQLGIDGWQEDEFRSHIHHSTTLANLTGSGGDIEWGGGDANRIYGFDTQATGGPETRPRNIATVFYIKY